MKPVIAKGESNTYDINIYSDNNGHFSILLYMPAHYPGVR